MDILILRRAPGKYRFRLNYIPGSLHWRIVGWRPPSKKSWIHRCHGENFFYFLSLQRVNEIYWKEKCGFSMHFKIKEITSIEKVQISKIFSVFLGFFNLGRFQTVTVTWHLHESESVKPGVFNGTFWNELRLFESPEPSTSKRTPHLVLPDCITKWWYRDPV